MSSVAFAIASDAPTAQGFAYLLYADGATVGTPLVGVVCVPLTPGNADCSVKLPAFTPGMHTVRLSAKNAAGEGPKSDPLDFVFVVAPGKPTNLRVP